jgi:hypothetical protein
MKTVTLILLTLCIVFCSSGVPEPVEEGVKFEQNNFTNTLSKAQKEDKLIMLDVYTDT